jgi:hypothetical protein
LVVTSILVSTAASTPGPEAAPWWCPGIPLTNGHGPEATPTPKPLANACQGRGHLRFWCHCVPEVREHQRPCPAAHRKGTVLGPWCNDRLSPACSLLSSWLIKHLRSSWNIASLQEPQHAFLLEFSSTGSVFGCSTQW